MKLFIDKENIYSYVFDYKSKKNERVDWLIRKMNIDFNFTKEEAKQDEVLELFIKNLLGEGQGDLPKFSDFLYPERPLTERSFKENVCSRSAFLVRDDNTAQIKSLGRVIVGEVGEEMELLESMLFGDKLHKNLSIGNTFNMWSDLEKFRKPLTDIIIVDRELIKGSKSDDSVLYNLKGLLNSLIDKNYKNINILLFTYKDQVWTKESLSKLIEKIVIEKTGSCANFTLVASDPPGKSSRYVDNQRRIGHDRNVITNYQRIKLNDSIPNYFLPSDGSRKTTSNDIDIYSIAEKEYLDTINQIISELQIIVDSGSCLISGSKKSRFIKFKD